MTGKNQRNHSHHPLTRQEVTTIFARLLRSDADTGDLRGLARRLGSNPQVTIPFL